MSRINRRQRWIYAYTALVAAIAVVNGLFFIILYQPTRSEYSQLQESIRHFRAEAASRLVLLHQKEKILAQLDTSNQDRTELVTKHFIPLDVGFVQVQPDLERFAQRSAVKKIRVDETRDENPQFGLYSVKIKLPVQGAYSNIVNFVKEIESSPTFYIIHSIDVRSGGENSFQTAADNISLDMTLETFFYQ